VSFYLFWTSFARVYAHGTIRLHSDVVGDLLGVVIQLIGTVLGDFTGSVYAGLDDILDVVIDLHVSSMMTALKIPL
jgi:hypothetical protein